MPLQSEEVPLLNTVQLDRFSGQPNLVQRLIGLFHEVAPEYTQKINEGIESGDLEQVAFNAHSLKGTAAEMGAERLAAYCQQMQTVAKAGDQVAVTELAGLLFSCFGESSAALKALENRSS